MSSLRPHLDVALTARLRQTALQEVSREGPVDAVGAAGVEAHAHGIGVVNVIPQMRGDPHWLGHRDHKGELQIGDHTLGLHPPHHLTRFAAVGVEGSSRSSKTKVRPVGLPTVRLFNLIVWRSIAWYESARSAGVRVSPCWGV